MQTWTHNGIDTKGVGTLLITNNVAHDEFNTGTTSPPPVGGAACYYNESNFSAGTGFDQDSVTENITFIANTCYNNSIGVQCSGGGTAQSNVGTNTINCYVFNNVFQNLEQTASGGDGVGIYVGNGVFDETRHINFNATGNVLGANYPLSSDSDTETSLTAWNNNNDGAAISGTITMRWHGADYTSLNGWQGSGACTGGCGGGDLWQINPGWDN